MDCSFYREAISARIDGEEHGLEADALDAHLASCRACQNWEDRAVVATRRARMAPAEQVPDLAAAILDGARARQTPGRPV